MIPMMKKRGRTVLGVRIGLEIVSVGCGEAAVLAWSTHCHAFSLCCRNAVSRRKKPHIRVHLIEKSSRNRTKERSYLQVFDFSLSSAPHCWGPAHLWNLCELLEVAPL